MGFLRQLRRRAGQDQPDPLDLRVLLSEMRSRRIEVHQDTTMRGALGSAGYALAGPIGLYVALLFWAPTQPPIQQVELEPDHEAILRGLLERQAHTTLAAVGTRNEDEEADRLRHLGRRLLSEAEPRMDAHLREEELGFGTPLTDREAAMGIANMQRRWLWLQKNWEMFGWQTGFEKRVF